MGGGGDYLFKFTCFFSIRLLVVLLFSVILEVITMRGGDQRGKVIERSPPC